MSKKEAPQLIVFIPRPNQEKHKRLHLKGHKYSGYALDPGVPTPCSAKIAADIVKEFGPVFFCREDGTPIPKLTGKEESQLSEALAVLTDENGKELDLPKGSLGDEPSEIAPADDKKKKGGK